MSSQATALAIGLTSAELERGRRAIDTALQGIVQSTQGLSEAQWNFKPSPECWSIAQILEHVVVVQDRILGPMWEQLMAAPAPVGYDSEAIEEIIAAGVPDRSAKFPAPEPMRPTGQWTPAVSMQRFVANDTAMRKLLESTPDLRHHAVLAMPVKAMSKGAYELVDGFGWLLLLAGHSQRHALQIQEVKANQNFPK